MKKKSSGRTKVLAHRFLRGEAIPLFRDRRANREIDEHVTRIERARTRRRRDHR